MDGSSRVEREMNMESSVWLNTSCSKCVQRIKSQSEHMRLVREYGIVDAVYIVVLVRT